MLDIMKEMLKDIQKAQREHESDPVEDTVHILERMHGFRLFHDENDVTNEEILKYDLVGVVDVTLEGLPAINVIKNTMNGVTGKIPLQMWLSLVDDKIEKSKHDTKEGPVSKASEPEKNEFDRIFDEFTDIFSEGFATATEAVNDAIEKIKSEDLGTEVQSAFDNTIEKVLHEKENISIKLELAELKMIREKAIKNKVQTKGFLRKIDKRILLVEAFLEA